MALTGAGRTHAGGRHRAIVAAPPQGIISVAPDRSLPRSLAINPTTLELSP
ncbi:hypothetical protein [Paracoccus sp. SM22M-07]|uniref:hypothetical protein n=1 Tax=Paracoccus sp. SM22M-07 TaxID=1520813 RepID=UPI000ACA8998|nr:hypothetical protein [Paracoccus sp. SM22M-07]